MNSPHLFPLLLAFVLIQPTRALDRPEGVRGLPQKHEYQKQIRTFLGTLKEQDFEPIRGKKFELPPNLDADETLRLWALSIDPVRIGFKRSAPSVNLPSAQFVLSYLESPANQDVMRPSAWSEPLVWLANWKHAGNPYQGSRALKLRAFVIAIQDLMMMDEQMEFSKAPLFHRADWLGPHLVMYAYVYEGVKDILPEATRKAVEAGLKKMVSRVLKDWGPKGEETFLDMQTAVALAILHKAMDDAELKPAMETYFKRFFTAGEFYHPSGYFPDQGCFDTGFNGLTLYFATWLAVRGDVPSAKEATAQAWKLRGYLMLPEPDAKHTLLSPTHMTFRTAGPVAHDQWPWPFRAVAGGYLTDDALCQANWPKANEIKEGAARAIGTLNAMLLENPGGMKNEDLKSLPWAWRLWPNSGVFPMGNYAHEHYPKGFAKHLGELQQKESPLLKVPFERPGTFIERFDKAFVIAKNKDYGVIIHTGPISEYPGKGLLEYPNAPYGLSGGSLSAFWTPAAGSVILGRRGGMSVPGGKPTNFDKPEEWRNWPVHAVIGSTASGKFFTSARIQKPETSSEVKDNKATVAVKGIIPAAPLGKEKSLEGKLEYSRTFEVGPDGVRIETGIKGDGVDQVAELYEVIPALHRDEMYQAKDIVATIEFMTNGSWVAAGVAYTDKVTAIRITRFKDAVVIKLDRPRRVKLSPAETGPGFLTHGVSRNVLIDLLENAEQPAKITKDRSIHYTLVPNAK